MKTLSLVAVFLHVCGVADVQAQGVPIVKASELIYTEPLHRFSLVAVDSSGSPEFLDLPPSAFHDELTGYFDHTIPLKDTHNIYYFSFTAENDTKDTTSFFIYSDPQESVDVGMTDHDGNLIKKLPVLTDTRSDVDQHYFLIPLAPGEIHRLVLRIAFPQARFSRHYFWVGPSSRFFEFVWFRIGISGERALNDALVLGMIAMMFIYMVSKYIQIRKLEYLYYSAYTFCFLAFFSIKATESLGINWFYTSPFVYSFLYRLTQMLAYWMYYLFIQEFLNTKTVFPRAHKLINYVIIFIVSYCVLEVVLYFIPSSYLLQWTLWDIARIVLAVTGLAFTISFIFIGNVLSRYLIFGGSALAFFGMLSMLFSAYPEWIWDWPTPFGAGIFYFQAGIMLELLSFALGLGHKNKMDEIEKVEAKEALKLAEERQHVKHLHALAEVQEGERSRFAKDLHDGLGGMLWGIKLSLSNMKGNMILSGEMVPVFERSLDMLDNSIHELRRVAHNLMPEALVKFGLTAALKDFCDFVNSSKVIKVIFQQVGTEKRLDISTEVALYRIINELVNNALRHSSATELLLQLNYDEPMLTITVEDNGSGFDKAILDKTTGAGWPNIKSRVEYLKGSLDIETSPGNGTSINITIPA